MYVAYNNVFRLLHNLPKQSSASGMFVSSNVKNCSAVIRNVVYKFMQRLEVSENSIIKRVLNSDMYWQSRIRKHWYKLLYINNDFI